MPHRYYKRFDTRVLALEDSNEASDEDNTQFLFVLGLVTAGLSIGRTESNNVGETIVDFGCESKV